eukprot:4753255-Pleurochrysis_carterae.AAC.1
MRDFDNLCRYMAERHLSKYVSLTRANSCNSFSGFAEAHKVTEAFNRLIAAIERYIKPEYGSSDSTFSDDHAGPLAEVPELARLEFGDAEPLEEADISSASPHVRWAQFVTEREEWRRDLQARIMDARKAHTRRN